MLVRGGEEIEDCVTRSKYLSFQLSPELVVCQMILSFSVDSLPLSWAERLLLLSLTTRQMKLFQLVYCFVLFFMSSTISFHSCL